MGTFLCGKNCLVKLQSDFCFGNALSQRDLIMRSKYLNYRITSYFSLLFNHHGLSGLWTPDEMAKIAGYIMCWSRNQMYRVQIPFSQLLKVNKYSLLCLYFWQKIVCFFFVFFFYCIICWNCCDKQVDICKLSMSTGGYFSSGIHQCRWYHYDIIAEYIFCCVPTPK